MVKLEDSVIAKLSTHGTEFEVLVDPDLALDFRADEDVDIKEVLAAEKVFKDSSSGKKASEEKMEDIFETSDPLQVAKEVINEGDIQVTTRQRKEMRKNRRKELIHLISRRAINPQKDIPHPPKRIKNALEQTNFQVDPFKNAEEQMQDAVEVLRPIIPLSFETRKILAKFPPEFGGKAHRVVEDEADIMEDEWLNDGSWAVKVEIPAGRQSDFFQKVNDLTSGEVETKVVDKE